MDVSKAALAPSADEVVKRWRDVGKPEMVKNRRGEDTDKPVHGSTAQRVGRAMLMTVKTLTLVHPVMIAWTQPRRKEFGTDVGDDVVEEWCGDEVSMAVRAVEFVHTMDESGDIHSRLRVNGNERVTYRTLEVICTKSIWLVHLDISECRRIEGDLAPVGLLLGLRVFKAEACEGLTGA